MDGNTIVRNLEVEEKVKIRPLMDGNLHGAVHSLKKLQVKIRPLMDGNINPIFNIFGVESS